MLAFVGLVFSAAVMCHAQSTETLMWDVLMHNVDTTSLDFASGNNGTVTYSTPQSGCYVVFSNNGYEKTTVGVCNPNDPSCVSLHAVMSSCSSNPVYEIQSSLGMGVLNPFNDMGSFFITFITGTGVCILNEITSQAVVYTGYIEAPGMPPFENSNDYLQYFNYKTTVYAGMPLNSYDVGMTASTTSNLLFSGCNGIPNATQAMVTFQATMIVNGTSTQLSAPFSNTSDWTVMVILSVFRSTTGDGIYAAAAIAPSLYPQTVTTALANISAVGKTDAEKPLTIFAYDNRGIKRSIDIRITNITLANLTAT